MPILIDGHNLIGQGSLPGIHLSDSDDEYKLVLLLRRYATRKRGRRIEVVFDRGSYGHPDNLNGYGVRCHFARLPRTADHELIHRIRAIKRRAEWEVVTSDRAVAGEARARGIVVVSSDEFANRLLTPEEPSTKRRVPDKPRETNESYKHRTPSQAEVEEWLRIFGDDAEG
jgi:hypothetical protein